MVFFLIFLFALVILLKAADWFVDASDAIARHLRLPASIIGATIVAFGTSAPELFVSGFAAKLNQPDVILVMFLEVMLQIPVSYLGWLLHFITVTHHDFFFLNYVTT